MGGGVTTCVVPMSYCVKISCMTFHLQKKSLSGVILESA